MAKTDSSGEVPMLDPDECMCVDGDTVCAECACEIPGVPFSDTNGGRHFVGTLKGHALEMAF